MTERSYGLHSWLGEVVNVQDPDKEGRVQVRIHGLYDDKSNIPDDQLPWVKPAQDVTSSGHNKIGKSPVGLIKGATVFGYFLDSDRQYPFMTHSIAKAGDADSSTTQNGQTTLMKGTNSTPIAERNSNNAFITRQSRNIQMDDSGQNDPQQQNDSDGKDITAEAAKKTKFSTMPTIGSIASPSGSVLTQLKQVDPQNLTAVLKKSVDNFIKLDDLSNFSSGSGINNVLGQVLGQAMSAIGASNVMNQMATNIPDPTQLSLNAQIAILTALQNLGPAPTSTTVSSIIGSTLQPLLSSLLALINNKTLNLTTFEALIEQFFGLIQNNGSTAAIGANQGNILSMLSSMIPQLSGPINQTLDDHLPSSVLNQQKIITALQKFAMSQAYLKKPVDGKKALAMAAVQQTFDTSNLTGQLSGLTSAATSFISKLNPIAN